MYKRSVGLVIIAMLLATAGLVLIPSVVGGNQAQAVTIKAIAQAKNFDPGNIVADSVFFDGSALNAKQVQAFLNARVPNCNTSSSGPTCLRNYRQDTPTMPADEFCKKYTGATNQSAAKIIAKVGKACGISQKALLVLLEKEQSLVTAGSSTSNVPTEYKYKHATGFACPDTAGCDPKYEGIFYQLYYGARQYKRYANDDYFNWITIGVNQIMEHPKVATNSPGSCKRVKVTIKNQATVGLYFYTPYVPNAAALANLYGTGDSCSSYGNRNFWRIFTDWFGSTQIPVRGDIQKYWISKQSHAGALGVPTGTQQCSSAGRCVQKFQGGYVAVNKKSQTFPVPAAIASTWIANGGWNGTLGWPRKPAKCATNSSNCQQRFDGGNISISSRGNYAVPGKIAKLWRAKKTFNGAIGVATKPAKCMKNGNCRQRFAGGFIAAKATTKAYLISNKTAKTWKQNRAKLGYPIAKQTCSKPNKKGNRTCVQRFAKGKIKVTKAGKIKVKIAKK